MKLPRPFGGNEGIYLTMYLKGKYSKEGLNYDRVQLGTFKTLRDDRNALKYMSGMMSDFIWNGRKFVNENIDDFDHPTK